MRHYVCECQVCHTQQQYAFEEPYPALGAIFSRPCNACCDVTPHTRVLTKRAQKELRAQQEESALRQVILDQCVALGFQARFLYQSVIDLLNLPASLFLELLDFVFQLVE